MPAPSEPLLVGDKTTLTAHSMCSRRPRKPRLRLTFEDGTVGDVSYTSREWTGVLEPLRDPRVFAEVFVDEQMGTLGWPNGIDFAPEPLYAEARANPVMASR
jgi:Protein of unknown function (DUF2442)